MCNDVQATCEIQVCDNNNSVTIERGRIFKCTYNGWKATLKTSKDGKPYYAEFASIFDSYKRSSNDEDFDEAVKFVMSIIVKYPEEFSKMRNHLNGKYYQMAEEVRMKAKKKAAKEAKKIAESYDF